MISNWLNSQMFQILTKVVDFRHVCGTAKRQYILPRNSGNFTTEGLKLKFLNSSIRGKGGGVSCGHIPRFLCIHIPCDKNQIGTSAVN